MLYLTPGFIGTLPKDKVVSFVAALSASLGFLSPSSGFLSAVSVVYLVVYWLVFSVTSSAFYCTASVTFSAFYCTASDTFSAFCYAIFWALKLP